MMRYCICMPRTADLFRINETDPDNILKNIAQMDASFGSSNTFRKCCYYFIKARHALVAGEEHTALIHAEMTLKLAKQMGYLDAEPFDSLFYALVLHVPNRIEAAEAQLAEAGRMINRYDLKLYRLYYLLIHAHFLLFKGHERKG